MTRLASRFGRVNSVRRDCALTHDELSHCVPGNLVVRLQQAMT